MRSELITTQGRRRAATAWLPTAALLAAALLLASCGEDGPTCASGTTLKAGKCVAAELVCGAGTHEVQGVCVADSAADAVDATSGGDGAGSDATTGDSTGDTGGGGGGTDATTPPDKLWTCAPAAFGDGQVCDCGCGFPDPDCTKADLPVVGCDGAKCQADGTCAACVPECSGKSCGPDGCGGVCGLCQQPGLTYCQDGACVAKCQPKCGAPAGSGTGAKTCGPDGCGGVCGTCGEGETCTFGACVTLTAGESCFGHCGSVASSGCGCTNACKAAGTCCADFATICGCTPDCSGKTCGSDGCGGVCGACKDGETCTEHQCVDDPCEPDPCAGNGLCSAADGSCACSPGFAGEHCEMCATGYSGYPNCVFDLCKSTGNTCSGHGACQPATNGCECNAGFTGAACDACAAGFGTYPSCTDPCAGAPDCDDGNACTDDSCQKNAGCVHLANTLGCSDGDACTVGDVCEGGKCVGGGKVCGIEVNAADDVDDGKCDATHCSLREAIAAANADADLSAVGILVAGPIVLTKPLPTITAKLNLSAPGANVTIDGGAQFRIFHAKADLKLANLTLTKAMGDAKGGGAVWMEAGALGMLAVTVQQCTSVGPGAAVLAPSGAQLSGCVIQNNTVTAAPDGKPSAVVLLGGTAKVESSRLQANSSNAFGGALGGTAGGSLTVVTSSFVDNAAFGGAGLAAFGTLTVANSTFWGNKAKGEGGALYAKGTTSVIACTLAANQAPTVAGLSCDGALTLRNTLIGDNVGGKDCSSGSLFSNVANLVEDGSCNAKMKGVTGIGTLGDNGGPTPTVGLAPGSPAVDAGDDATCAAAPVGGKDQRGVVRPKGLHCDVGAFEVL